MKHNTSPILSGSVLVTTAYHINFKDVPYYGFLSTTLCRVGARVCGYGDIGSVIGFDFTLDLDYAHM